MPYRKYVEMRKASNNQIRRYLRFGRLYYLSAEIVTVETSLGKSQHRKSYPPFVGSVPARLAEADLISWICD